MIVKPGEHVTVIGATGAGKTYFVRNALLPAFSRVLVLDTEDYDFVDFPAVSVKTAVRLAKSEYSFYARIVFSGAPSADEPRLDELVSGLLESGHDLAVYADEVTDWSDAHRIPDSLRALIRKGRKRRITVIAGTQRPAMLSKDYWNNAVHHVTFYIQDYDAVAIKDYAPYVAERRSEIPYGSHRSLYQAPNGEVLVLGPAVAYDWSKRPKP